MNHGNSGHHVANSVEEANEAETGHVPQPRFHAAEEAKRRRTVIHRLVLLPLVPTLRLPAPRVRIVKGFFLK